MSEFTFDSESYFFEEIRTFSIPFVGLVAVVRFPELKAQVDYLISRYKLQQQRISMPDEVIPNIVIPDMFTVTGNVVTSTLMGCQAIASDIQNGEAVRSVRWVDEALLSREDGVLIETPMEVEKQLAPTAQVTLGAAFERVKDAIEGEWGNNPSTWPSELQYFRHCRNAAYHGNRFLIFSYHGIPGIDPSNPPTWRSSIMSDASTMNGRGLIGDWLSIGDIPVLLGDVETILRQNGVTP
jgi:hypothetical protein